MKNEYYHKLTELKKREPKRIDLGVVDDLENAIEKLDNLRDSAYGLNKDVLTLQQNIKPLLKEKREYEQALKDNSFVDKAEANIKKTFNVLAKEAAALGIAVNKLPVYKEYEKSKNLLKEIDKFKKDAKTILSKIK